MAHTAPIILAFLLNCCEIFIFRSVLNISHTPCCAALARDIFSIGNYFLLLSLKLYPKAFRRIHWVPRSFIEFILGVYLFETFLCDFWYPLEYFTHYTFQKIVQLLRKHTPSTGAACIVLCNFAALLSNKKVPEALSIALSTFITLIVIHGTRTVDFGILRRCGVKDFALHVKEQITSGVTNFVASLLGRGSNCRCSSAKSR